MAARYWIEGTSGNWDDTANWSASSGGSGGASVPGASDDVTFDGNGLGDCTCDVAININSLTVEAAYTGILDLADSGYSHSITNDVFAANTTGKFDWGDATTTIGGNLDTEAAVITKTGGNLIVLTGTGKTFSAGNSSSDAYNVRIEGSITSVGTLSRIRTNDLTIASGGTLTLNQGIMPTDGTLTVEGTLDLATEGISPLDGTYIASTGVVTGAHLLNVRRDITIESGATINCGVLQFFQFGGRGQLCEATGGTVTFNVATEFRIDNDDIEFKGDFIFDCQCDFGHDGTTAVDNSTYNPNMTFKNDIPLGPTEWRKGTGLITFSGTAGQSVNFAGEATEDWDIDKTAGTVTLSGDVEVDSLTLTQGGLDINSNTLTITGALSAPGTNATTVDDSTGGGLIDAQGAFDVDNVTWTDANVDAADSPPIASNSTISNSDASGGNTIDAADNCVDNGGNVNWDFIAAGRRLFLPPM